MGQRRAALSSGCWGARVEAVCAELVDSQGKGRQYPGRAVGTRGASGQPMAANLDALGVLPKMKTLNPLLGACMISARVKFIT